MNETPPLKSFKDLARLLSRKTTKQEGKPESPIPKRIHRKRAEKTYFGSTKSKQKKADGVSSRSPSVGLSPSHSKKPLNVPAPPSSPISTKNNIDKEPTIASDRTSLNEFEERFSIGSILPTNSPSKEDLSIIRSRFDCHEHYFAVPPNAEKDRVDVIIGLDIGSTSTKVVIRMPYGEDIGLPVPAPEWFRADDHPYYWRTLLWKAPTGHYSLKPECGAKPISRLKVELLSFNRGDRAAIKNAMVAYIVLMARQAMGWLYQTRPTLFHNGLVVVDEVNLGMPFTDHREAHPDQIEIAAAASHMLNEAADITEENISIAIQLTPSKEDHLVALQPELSAALHGFLNSHQRRDGKYLLTDIGGLTIDTVFFGYQEKSTPRVTVYAKSVECFGSEIVLRWCNQMGSEERATKVLGNLLAVVSKQALREKINVSPDNWKKPFELETILIGGGRHSLPHQNSIGWCERSMKNHAPPLQLNQRMIDPDQDDLDMPLLSGRNAGRLLVALGLSHSRHDLSDIRPPSEVANSLPVRTRNVADSYVGPEQL